MMNRTDAITACLAKNEQPAQKASFYASAVLSYATTKSNENVEEILSKLKQEDLLNPHLQNILTCVTNYIPTQHQIKPCYLSLTK
jgi:hypothetical protein